MKQLAKRVLRLLLHPLVIVPLCIGGYIYSLHHPIAPGLRACTWIHDSVDGEQCLTKRLQKLVRETSLERTLDKVDRMSKKSERIRNTCHIAWHPLGEKFGREARKRKADFPSLDAHTTCRMGFVHGAMLGYYSEGTDLGKVADVAGSICSSEPRKPIQLECVHGFGHIVGRSTRKYGNALDQCSRIVEATSSIDAPREELSHECQYGLFMEYGMLDFKEKRSWQSTFCAKVPERGQPECYLQEASRMMVLGAKVGDTRKRCLEIEGDPRDYCIRGYVKAAGKKVDCSDWSGHDRTVCKEWLKHPNEGFLIDLS